MDRRGTTHRGTRRRGRVPRGRVPRGKPPPDTAPPSAPPQTRLDALCPARRDIDLDGGDRHCRHVPHPLPAAELTRRGEPRVAGQLGAESLEQRARRRLTWLGEPAQRLIDLGGDLVVLLRCGTCARFLLALDLQV